MSLCLDELIEQLAILGVYPVAAASSSGGSSGGSSTVTVLNGMKEQPYTATPAMLAAKSVTLPDVPADPAKVYVTIIQGILQFPNVDFVVTGSKLDWASLGLESLLADGDQFVVRYTPQSSSSSPSTPVS